MNRLLDEFEAPTINCKGKIYRGKRNAFLNKVGEYVYQERMYLLKNKSCRGCEKCYWLEDDMKESIGNNSLPIIENIEHGALYELRVVNQTRDWESGIIDDYDLEFVKL